MRAERERKEEEVFNASREFQITMCQIGARSGPNVRCPQGMEKLE